MRARPIATAVAFVLLAPITLHDAHATEQPEPAFDPKLMQAMEYRLVGPYRGGRSTAVSGGVGPRDTF
jgi:hypothetical protein